MELAWEHQRIAKFYSAMRDFDQYTSADGSAWRAKKGHETISWQDVPRGRARANSASSKRGKGGHRGRMGRSYQAGDETHDALFENEKAEHSSC